MTVGGSFESNAAGVGIDVIELTRMEEILSRSGEVFLRRVFTDKEIERGRKAALPVHYFASAFAVKEAVFKALALDGNASFDLRDIEVGRGALGEPLARLHGATSSQCQTRGFAGVRISISYETNLAIAIALAVTLDQKHSCSCVRKTGVTT